MVASRLKGFARQVGWSLTGKVISAMLQLVVIVLLARSLPPSQFAFVASANVIMLAVVAVNGFGLIRQIQYRRSVRRDDPTLPDLFAVWQRFVLVSAALWLGATVGLHLVTGDRTFLALIPIAGWLVFEQVTTLWNGISVVDNRARDLIPSYLFRRAPVVLALAAAAALGWDVIWTWSLSMAGGSVLAWAAGRSAQEGWARRLLPRREQSGPIAFDFGYWWTEVGAQVRDLDVATISLVSSSIGGVYALPARLVRPMNLITVAAASVAFPRLARMDRVTRRQLLLFCVVGSTPAAVTALVVASCAGLLPDLVGPEYDAAVPVLRIMCLSAAVAGFGALVVTVLQARSREANRFAGYVLMTIGAVQLMATTAGAALDGATAAAWGATATVVVGTAALYWRADHECRLEMARAPRA